MYKIANQRYKNLKVILKPYTRFGILNSYCFVLVTKLLAPRNFVFISSLCHHFFHFFICSLCMQSDSLQFHQFHHFFHFFICSLCMQSDSLQFHQFHHFAIILPAITLHTKWTNEKVNWWTWWQSEKVNKWKK